MGLGQKKSCRVNGGGTTTADSLFPRSSFSPITRPEIDMRRGSLKPASDGLGLGHVVKFIIYLVLFAVFVYQLSRAVKKLKLGMLGTVIEYKSVTRVDFPSIDFCMCDPDHFVESKGLGNSGLFSAGGGTIRH